MNEIIFRGRRNSGDKFNGMWEFGDLFNGCYTFINGHKVDPKTVGQFTGLTDNSGAKIFGGDIVQFINPRKEYAEVCHGEVSYNTQFCRFVITFETIVLDCTIGDVCGLDYTLRGLNVIGNAHDKEVQNG